MHKLHTPHLASGYIADVALEATTDRDGRPDWTIVYTPGPKAKAEYHAFLRRGGEPVVEPDPDLVRGLVERGVTRDVAAELVRDFPEDHIRTQIVNLDAQRQKVKNPGAWLAAAIRKDFAVKPAPVAKVDPVADLAERARAERARARAERARVEAYLATLTAEEVEALDAEALAHAEPEARAGYEAATVPRMKNAMLRALREAYVEVLLAAPPPPGPGAPPGAPGGRPGRRRGRG
jgi:hypothetical protein